MSNTVIRIENLSKMYQLGVIGYGTLRADLRSAWAKFRGAEDPNVQIGKESRFGQKGQFWALRDVGFDVEQGSRVGIIGRNGAGKSTLLKILSRVTAPTQGTIKVKGRIASLLEVGTGFHPELTGRENVFLNGAILGMKRREIQAKFDEIVEFAGVGTFIDTPVKRYSSGMYVRLAFSVAAHLDSDILIIDEVLAVGDSDFQKKCIGKMEDVSRGEGRTVLFVSHMLEAVRKLCNSVVHIDAGSVKSISNDVDRALIAYVGNGGLGGAWHNDGSSVFDHFIPGSIRLLDSSSKVSNTFANSDKCILEITGECTKDDPELQVGIALYDYAYNLLFWSAHTDVLDAGLKGPGAKTLRLELPISFLNEGQFHVALFSAIYHKRWIIEPSFQGPSLTFNIIIGNTGSPYWQETRPGLLAPKAKWEIF